jgi:hypothetical protein
MASMAGRAKKTLATIALPLPGASLGCGSKQARPATPAASASASVATKMPPAKPSAAPPPRPADAAEAAAYYRQQRARVEQPDGSDVAQIDFTRLRRGRLYAGEPGISNDLMGELRSALDKPKPEELLAITTKMLAADPTDLRAQLVSASALHETGATAKADAHVALAKALLESIAHSGDGRSFQSPWVVYQVKEEYEFLEVLGLAVGGQHLEQQGERAYDVLNVQNPDTGAQGKAYFDVTELFAEEARGVSGG